MAGQRTEIMGFIDLQCMIGARTGACCTASGPPRFAPWMYWLGRQGTTDFPTVWPVIARARAKLTFSAPQQEFGIGAAAVLLALSLCARFHQKNMRRHSRSIPRDTIDLQSFLWGEGPGEYPNAHGPIAQRIDPTRVLHFGANKDGQNKVHRHRTALSCTAKKCSGKFLKNY
jgi:hypothetical protein